MKRFLILAVLLLTLVASVTASHTATIDLTGATLSYARSFDGAHEGALLKLPLNLQTWKWHSLNIGLAVEPQALDSADDTSLGIGVDINLDNGQRAVMFGAGWLPKGFGLSWNIGAYLIRF